MTRPAVVLASVAAAGLLALSLTADDRPTADARDPDDAAVRKVLADQVAAWNRGDLDAFMTGYWKDPGLFFISGGRAVKGFDALKTRYQTAYQGEGKEMGKLTFAELHTEPLGPARLVRGTWEVKTGKETVTGWFTLVFKKVGGEWKIVHDHTSK